jgi:hypothetical protein
MWYSESCAYIDSEQEKHAYKIYSESSCEVKIRRWTLNVRRSRGPARGACSSAIRAGTDNLRDSFCRVLQRAAHRCERQASPQSSISSALRRIAQYCSEILADRRKMSNKAGCRVDILDLANAVIKELVARGKRTSGGQRQ